MILEDYCSVTVLPKNDLMFASIEHNIVNPNLIIVRLHISSKCQSNTLSASLPQCK